MDIDEQPYTSVIQKRRERDIVSNAEATDVVCIHFNRRHGRTGHLFENRYKSILCEEDRYLLALIRYIYLNPIRAGIVKNMEELDNYPWSGHSVIMGKYKHEWMDAEYVLAQFGGSGERAKTE